LATERSHKDLRENTTKLESMREALEKAAKKYATDFALLGREKQACQALTDALNEKIAVFAASEGREKRMREELEWEVERLWTLVRTERESSQRRVQEAEDEVETARQRQRDQLHELSIRLEAAECKRDSLAEELDTLQKEFIRERQELTTQRDLAADSAARFQSEVNKALEELRLADEEVIALKNDKEMVVEKLGAAQKRLHEHETELDRLKRTLAVESEERKKVDALMKSLEVQQARTAKAEADLLAEKDRVGLMECDVKSLQARLDDEVCV
jgi:chromosome segregation ATPase